jgi:Fur family transcriptional regulator, ferric uptake regulator
MHGWSEHARETLTRTGHRSGGAREQIVDLLADQRCCLSAQRIHERLDRRVGLASVYRALDTLTRLHLVHRVDVDGIACYEPADPGGDHHHHAICDECGRLDPFEDDELERLIDRVGERLGYALGGHDLVLHGRCPDCAK